MISFEPTSSEELSLRRTVRDLAALAALPSIWVSADFPRGLQAVADMLRAALRAHLLYVRVTGEGGLVAEAAATESVRVNTIDPALVARHLAGQFDLTALNPPPTIAGLDGRARLRVLAIPVASEGQARGFVVACAARASFPSEHDRLLLTTGANHVAVLLQRHDADAKRRAQERSLAATEAQAQQLMQMLPAGVCVCDGEGAVQFYNRRAGELLGDEPQRGQSWAAFASRYRLFWPDGSAVAEGATPMLLAAREGRSFRDLELRIVRPDGVTIIACCNIDPVRDASGRPAGVINVFQDITERKRNEAHAAALANLSHELSLFTDEADILRVTTEAIGRHLDVERCHIGEFNVADTVNVLHSWTRDDSVMKLQGSYRIAEFVRPDDYEARAAVRLGIDDTTTDPMTRDFAARYLEFGVRALGSAPFVREGRRVAALTVSQRSPRQWTEGELALLDNAIARVWPLIERARAREALQRSEENFRMIADNIAALAWTADRLGWGTWYNRRWFEYTGTTLEEMKDRGWERVHHPDHLERVKRHLDYCLERGERWEDTFPLRGRDGNYRWFLSQAVPIRDENGNVIRWFGTNTDITELRETQEKLRERSASLETLNRIGSTLAAEHDLTKLVQSVTDAGREISKAAFGAFFYNVKDARGESYMLYTLSGAPREAFAQFPMPRNTELFGPTFRGEGIVRLGDVRQDPRFGKSPPHHGPPAGHLPVRSYLAVPVKSRTGAVLGGLFFGHPEPDRFTAEAESAVASLAAQAAIAIDNAELYQQAQRELAEHRRTEHALRESDARFQAILDNSLTVIFLKDAEGRYLMVNERFERLFHVTKQQAIGKTDAEVFPEPLARRFRENDLQVIARRCPIEFEEVAPHDDGPHTYISVKFPLHDESGAVYAVGGIATDITERKRAELQQQALYQLAAGVNRAAELGQIYEAALDAICRCQNANRASILLRDPDGVMRFKASVGLSEAYRRAVEGHSPWTPDDPNPQALWIDDIADATLAPELRAVIEKEGIRALAFIPLSYERRLLGKFMIYYNSPHAFSRENLRPVEAIASQVAFAIERQRSAEALDALVNERTASLRLAIEQMEEFSYSVSHDLRAPVRAMRGYAEALLEDYGARLDQEGTAMLARIQHNSARMDRLIVDLLTYSRISRRELCLEPVCLEKLLRDVVQQYPEMQAPRAAVDLCAPFPKVLAHEPSLTQVISNLLGNAVKFVAPGTRPQVCVRCELANERVRVWFEDNGIGIKPEYQSRLFGLFERVHGQVQFEGTGIGLAIVRKAVERMNGRVGVESDGRSGSRFWIELPVAKSA